MSEQTFDSYTAAMAWVQANLPAITKGSTNSHFGSKYADLADVSKAVLAVTAQAGFAWTTRPGFDDEGRYVLFGKLEHVSGGSEEGVWVLPSGTPQQVGSAITYGRRYLLTAITGAVADEDDDGHAASQARPQQQRAPRSQPKRAERGPLPPDDDPWVTGNVAKPADAAAVTDVKWMDGFRQRVAGCPDEARLRGLTTELETQIRFKHVSQEDAVELRALIAEQSADLTKQAERVAS